MKNRYSVCYATNKNVKVIKTFFNEQDAWDFAIEFSLMNKKCDSEIVIVDNKGHLVW